MLKRLQALAVATAVCLAGWSQYRILTQLRTVQTELAAVKTLVYQETARQTKPAPAQAQSGLIPQAPLSIGKAQVRGSHAAQVAIVEFSDFQCPYCGTAARGVLPEVERRYIDTGKVQLVFKHLPLPNHQFAAKAAEAANCAGEQGKFWDMHDRLFADQKALAVPDLLSLARTLKLDGSRFDKCLTGASEAATVSADSSAAKELGVTGTPTFFFGRVQSDGRIRVVSRFSGTRPFDQFKTVLDDLLSNSDK